MTDFTLTGRHVAGAFVAGFSIIIGVNITLAVSAVRTFPGLEVKNSYVASQHFDADRAAQRPVGGYVSAKVAGYTLTLRIDADTGPVAPVITQATLGRATHVQADRALDFLFDGRVHNARVPNLAPGNWNLRLVAVADDGTVFRQRIIIRAPR